MIDVVAAVLVNDNGEVLIARRTSKILTGFWEFPGGKIELGETAPESLVRELREEMDIEVEVKDYIGQSIYDYGNVVVKLMGYTAKIIKGNIKLNDHDEYKWIRIDKIRDYKLAPADIPILDNLSNII